MFPVIIRNHSPMDDYKTVLSQVKYTITYASNVADTEQHDYEENFYDNGFYNKANKAAVFFLILIGMVIVGLIVLGLVSVITHGKFAKLETSIYWMLLIICILFFIFDVLKFGISNFMELLFMNKESDLSIRLDRKTWVLENGSVVISDEQRKRTRQKRDMKTIMPMAEAPFKKMIIINKVYSITRTNGKIIVDAGMRELYRYHYITVNEYNDPPEADPTLLYYYYREDKRGKVYWYENMYGRERLLEALNGLKA